MNTKLTLRIDDVLIRKAKSEAKTRGKSASQMISEFIESLGEMKTATSDLPPVTSSLLGLLKGRRISESTYKKHLRKKYR